MTYWANILLQSCKKFFWRITNTVICFNKQNIWSNKWQKWHYIASLWLLRDKISCCVPVYGEDHFFNTTLDLILGFQVSHSFCWLTINGNNHVTNTEVGLGCFTSWSYLMNKVETFNLSNWASSTTFGADWQYSEMLDWYWSLYIL